MPRGGVRPGAGRPRKLKLEFAPKAQADTILEKLGCVYKGKRLLSEADLWLELLLSEDLRIRLETLKYLTNRAYGEPAQQIHHSVDHSMTIDEARALTRKMLEIDRKTLAINPIDNGNGTS